MKTFDYTRPETIDEAVAAAAEPGAAYLAAGTNLVDLMKDGIVRPDRLVDLNYLPGLDRIEHLPDGGNARADAGPSRVALRPRVRSHPPCLRSPHIRHRRISGRAPASASR